MWAQLPQKERVALYVVVVSLVLGLSVAGLGRLQRHEALPESKRVDSQEPEIPVRPAAPKVVVVDVEGAVKRPGVQRLPEDSRVEDGIHSAGGPSEGANLEELNLAAKLTDGTQLYVPHRDPAKNAGQVAEAYHGGPSAPDSYAARPSAKSAKTGGKHPAAPVNLNTASEEQLESLPGVGPSTAEKILQYRQDHGGFSSLEEIQSVKGLGPKKFAKLKPWIRL